MTIPTVAFQSPDQANGSTRAAANPRSFTSPAGVRYELVHVTPDLADKWLNENTRNRTLRTEAVEKLSRDMKARRFAENGDAIRFAASGLLLDGQHRLHGLIVSQTSAWMLVVSNLPESARDTVDDGTRRTMGDRFNFHGESDPATLAAVVRRALLWKAGTRTSTPRFQPSALESFAFLDAHPELRDAASAATQHRKHMKFLAPSTIGLTWWLFSSLNEEQCAEFFDRLGDGAMLNLGHPILTLRNGLLNLTAKPGRIPETYSTAVTIKSWNAYRAGRDMAIIRFSEHEKFPTPK